MTALQGEIETALAPVASAASGHDFQAALEALNATEEPLGRLEAAGNDPDRLAYLMGKAVTEGLIAEAEGVENESLAAMKAGFAGTLDAMRAAAQAGNYKEAAAQMNAATQDVAALMAEAQRDLDDKAAYEQDLAALKAGLTTLQGAERPTDPMTALAQEIEQGLAPLEDQAGSGDFSGAKGALAALQTKLRQLEGLANDPKRLAFLKASTEFAAHWAKVSTERPNV